MEGEREMRYCYRDVLPFMAMVLIECIIVGGNTLYKSATADSPINTYVFTTYVFFIGSLFLCPFLPIIRRTATPAATATGRRTNNPPLRFSIIFKLSVISLIGYLSQTVGYIGIKYGSPTLASVMSNLAPAFTFILAFFLRLEKLDMRSFTTLAKVVGTMVSIAGALVATLYDGPSVVSNTMFLRSPALDWVIGAILLATQTFLLSLVFVAQAQITKEYPVDFMLVLVLGLSGLIIAGVAGLIMVRDFDAWIIKSGKAIAAVIYMGLTTGCLSVAIQLWTLRIKGPVYVAMFKPLSIVIAVVMGVLFLGDSLHLGSVIGGTVISVGFYAVLWAKAKEEKQVLEKLQVDTGTFINQTTPFLAGDAGEDA